MNEKAISDLEQGAQEAAAWQEFADGWEPRAAAFLKDVAERQTNGRVAMRPSHAWLMLALLEIKRLRRELEAGRSSR
jgi:hypothetical protein